jgi:hypothetical protein
MKIKFYLHFVILFVSILFVACEKVINVDLNDSAQQIVIEGNITNSGQPCEVKITKTINFDETNNFPTIDNASVTLSDNAGNSEVMQNTSQGIYKSSSIIGIPGRTYTLKVVFDSKEYTAVSTMPYQISLDSLKTDSVSFFGSTQRQITPLYTDSLGIVNFYRFKLIVNGIPDKTIFVEDDELTDGRQTSKPLFGGDIEIEQGDIVQVQMMCIDKPVHLYFFSLSQTQSGDTGAPANPVSNFSGGCLGYFSANTFEEKSIIAQ